jgi:hypothetical protein
MSRARHPWLSGFVRIAFIRMLPFLSVGPCLLNCALQCEFTMSSIRRSVHTAFESGKQSKSCSRFQRSHRAFKTVVRAGGLSPRLQALIGILARNPGILSNDSHEKPPFASSDLGCPSSYSYRSAERLRQRPRPGALCTLETNAARPS